MSKESILSNLWRSRCNQITVDSVFVDNVIYPAMEEYKNTNDNLVQDIKRIILLEREHKDKYHHFIDEIDLQDFIEKNI